LGQKIDYSRLGISDIPISARWILQIVNENEGISQGEIAQMTGISRRTIQTSLQLLIDQGLLARGSDPSLRDARRVGYYRMRPISRKTRVSIPDAEHV
jgi:predicted transcriptional regulator